MKSRRSAAVLTAALLLAASATVSATSSASSASSAEGDAVLSPRSPDAGFDGHGTAVPFTADADQCVGLPRNTLLASCPAPCLADAPCIVYDQDAEHSQLTGCDYATGSTTSFCTSKPAATCEFHCFPLHVATEKFVFWVDFNAPSLGEPRERTADDPSVIAKPDYAFQTNDFVGAIGKLNVSTKIANVEIIGDVDEHDSDRFVDVTVDPMILANAPSVTTLALWNLPLDSDQAAAIVASAPAKLRELLLTYTKLETLSWKMFSPVPRLQALTLANNRISLISGSDFTMQALTQLDLGTNKLTGFDLRAPKLVKLGLRINRLVRIPQSVFSYSKLQSLDLSGNPLIKPLVLTALQAKFLMSLPELYIELVDPPDEYIVSRVPIGGAGNYGDYSDDIDISSLLVGGREFFLFGDSSLPAIIVDSIKAATYNNVLELRARSRVETSGESTPALAPAPAAAAAPELEPEPAPTPSPTRSDSNEIQGSCLDLPRNTLLASCPSPCLPDAPCIVYDQDAQHSKLTGCDYDTGAPNSFCFSKPTETCEIQCFAKYASNDTYIFYLDLKELILRKPRPRPAQDPLRIAIPMTTYPYQTNDFVVSIGKLNVSSKISAVEIYASTDSEDSTRFVDVTVDPAIFSNSPSLTSLSLWRLPLGDEQAATIVASAPSTLRKLDLHGANLTVLPWNVFVSVPNLEILLLGENRISIMSGDDFTMPALAQLDLNTNKLTGFKLRAPNLANLDLRYNQLVRIPDSVFSLSKLQSLAIHGNPIIRPLVLTAEQVQFLEALSDLSIQLVDPPDSYIVSRLPIGAATDYGSYTDDVDISSLLVDARDTVLRGDTSVPVRVVDTEKAALYNNLLELRARARVEPTYGALPSVPGEGSNGERGSCLDLPRNTVLASCPAPCLPDTPCIVYDQDVSHSMLTGCDYDTASPESFCASKPTEICEFHCFSKVTFKNSFLFWIRFKASNLGDPRTRTVEDPRLIATPSVYYPYQSNDFVAFVGKLNLSESVSTVSIAGENVFGDTTRFPIVDVDPDILDNAPSVTSLELRMLPLSNDQIASIIVSAPAKLKQLSLTYTRLTEFSSTEFARLPNLEVLSLVANHISRITGNDSMTALRELDVGLNQLTAFDLRAPNLTTLSLQFNQLVRIPPSVFTYSKLQSLSVDQNVLIRPLVLTAPQVQFLEALPHLQIDLVESPDPNLVGRLPVGGANYSNYSDDIDLSLLLVGATETLLRGDPELPVRVVDSDKAATYNDVLEARARVFLNTTAPDQYIYVPRDICQGVQRNTLLSYCAETCPRNGACVAFDRSSQLRRQSGCDYQNAASPSSVCTTSFRDAATCEFQCFPAYEPQSQFKFLIPFTSELGAKINRLPDAGDLVGLKTTEIPFLSNSFVKTIGVLNLTSSVTEVWISGGRSEKGTAERVADVAVSARLLSKAPYVTSLSLLNIDLSKSDVGAIFASASSGLKFLNLRNTNLKAIPEGVLANLPQLETLTLAQNSLTTVEVATVLPKLTTLDLSENALTTIDVKAPNLKTLDLSGNNLVRIPVSVFVSSRLHTVNLKDNLLTFPLVLSQAQLAFLNTVADLQFDSVANLGLSQPAPATSPTTTAPGPSPIPPASLASPTIVPGSAGGAGSGALLINGTVVEVGGVPAIIVDELTANQYNDQLEQKQKESILQPRTRSTGDGGAPPNSTRSTSGSSFDSSGLSTGTSTSGYFSSNDNDTQGSAPDGKVPSAGSSGGTTGSGIGPSGEKMTTPASKEDANSVSDASNASGVTKLLLGGVGSAFFVAILILFIVLKRRRADPDKESSYVGMTDSGGASSALDSQLNAGQVVSWWRDDVMLSHRLNAADIGDLRVIGSGGHGVMWLVNYRGGQRQLVSKRLIQSDGPTDEAKALGLVAEAKIASSLRYPSIVPFVGVAWTDKTDLQVLYEYMPNGDLGSYLARVDPASLPWFPNKLQLAINIIEALVYTHSFNPPLLHRDLKCSNMLLDDDFKAKLGGFGCARPESENDTMTASGIGTGRWLAPEILSGSTSYGASSDIYSFGVILCELDTHQVPYAEESKTLSSESELLQRVASGELRPSVSASCPEEIREMAEACMAFDPEQRPSAMEVSHSLRSLRRQSQPQ